MDKKEYLVRTFSWTKRKDYENYILNAVWQQMNYPQLRPVTQQYVKNGKNEYYLMDLYFPQLNVGVEVDEAYHKNNQEKDKLRTLDIMEKLGGYLCIVFQMLF
ncbi:AbaSI family restriction endonuclease [Facklamia sp. P12934]|uniref:AbaSI family restriction endonuclease n=1 Tax=Facklamia sp. P12934 TaxID=3421948 RepID=UPI003D1864CD